MKPVTVLGRGGSRRRLQMAPLMAVAALSQACWAATDAAQTTAAPARAYAFPHLTWPAHAQQFADPARPVRYDIQIAADRCFAALVDEDSVALPRYVHDRPFEPGVYFWRVRAATPGQAPTAWSKPASFTIVAPDETVKVAFDPERKDHTVSVRAATARAIALARKGRSVELRFPPGDYRFGAALSGPLIRLDGVRDVSVRGAGATLHFSSRKQGLLVAAGSERVSISGFRVEYAQGALRVQGRVKAVEPSARRLTVAIEPGFPAFDASDSPLHDIFILLDPNRDGRIKDRASTFCRMKDDYRRNDDGTWTITIDGGDFSDWQVGDRFVFHFRGGSPMLVDCSRSRAVTAYDLAIGGWGGMGFVSIEGSLFNILHCKTFMQDGKWMMGNADGVHIRGHLVGPWIEGVEIQALGDDAIALYARPASMVSVSPDGDRNAAVCSEEFFNLAPGDEVAFFQPLKGTILLETTVEQVRKRPDGRYRARFAAALPEGVICDGKLIEKTQIWNRSKSCGDFMIRNCKFTNIRRYGTVFRSKGGVVADCVYRGISTRAIVFSNGTQWPNGLYASEIIVRDNSITDSGFDGSGSHAVISFRFNGHRRAAQSIGPRNILIESNVVADCPAPAIELLNSKNVVLRGNRRADHAGRTAPATYAANRSRDVVQVAADRKPKRSRE